MTLSQICETLAFINNDEMEVMEIKSTDLLISLMEESPTDESDHDEKLDSLIRSFEAEISGSSNHDSTCTGSQLKSNFEEDFESWNIEQAEGHEYWASSPSSDGFGVEWVDNMDFIPFDDGSWSTIDPYGDEKDSMVCEGFDMEEHANTSIWQDNYELQMVH